MLLLPPTLPYDLPICDYGLNHMANQHVGIAYNPIPVVSQHFTVSTNHINMHPHMLVCATTPSLCPPACYCDLQFHQNGLTTCYQHHLYGIATCDCGLQPHPYAYQHVCLASNHIPLVSQHVTMSSNPIHIASQYVGTA